MLAVKKYRNGEPRGLSVLHPVWVLRRKEAEPHQEQTHAGHKNIGGLWRYCCSLLGTCVCDYKKLTTRSSIYAAATATTTTTATSSSSSTTTTILLYYYTTRLLYYYTTMLLLLLVELLLLLLQLLLLRCYCRGTVRGREPNSDKVPLPWLQARRSSSELRRLS